MADENNFSEQSSEVAKERLEELGTKKATKRASTVLAKGGKLLGKGIAFIAKALISALGPYILIFLVIVLLGAITYDFVFESRGKEQGYQTETIREDNSIQRNENGDYISKNLSNGNKMVKAFYTVLSDKSYYKIIGNDPKAYPADAKKSDKGIDLTKVADKYDREKMFYLNPNALWTLDEFLNNNKFRYPEQFLKPVPYNPTTLELLPITDDKDNIIIKSTEYDSKTNLPTGNKVEGVWDYGFAPVLHYVELKEQKEIRGNYVSEEYWDEMTQTVKTRDLNNKIFKTYEVNGFPKTIYMIDKVVTSAGNISNNIVEQEVMGDSVKKEEVYDTKLVDIYEWVEEQIEKERTVTKTRMVEKKRVTDEWTTCNLETDSGYIIEYPCYKEEIYYEEETYTEKEKYFETVRVWKKTEQREVQLRRFYEGNYYETIPRYEGSPDTSMITGNKYFKDYFLNYTTYVPTNVMGKFDFKSRTGKEEDEIDKILEEAEFNSEAGLGGGATVDMGQFQLGSGSSSQAYKNSLQYLPYFQKWGKVYGVDPYLLVAKASQESGGNHEKYLSSERCNTAGCGLMQIEKPGKVITGVTAYNFDTRTNDTVNVTGIDSVRTVDDNIRVGTMEFASRLASNKYNVLLSIQAYNYGPGGTNAVLKLYSQETGKSIEQIKQDVGDTGWMRWRSEVHNNPSKYFSWGGNTYGDDQYIEHVLRYYKSLEGGNAPYVVKPDGTKVEATGNLTTGYEANNTVAGSSWMDKFTSWIRSKYDSIKENWVKLFPNKPSNYAIEKIPFTNRIKEKEVQDIINMMFVMEEKKYLSEYDNMTDEMWKQQYSQLFTNPMGAYWEPAFNINSLNYFPSGFTTPITISNPQIIKGFGHVNNGSSTEYHKGVDVVAPPGTNIYAVADGVVRVAESNGANSYIGKHIEITHSASITTIYGNLDKLDIKAGDKVTKGQKIGVAGKSGSENGYLLHFELIKDGFSEDGSWIITGRGVSQVATGPLSIEGSKKAQEAYRIMSQYLGSWYAWGGSTPPKKDASGVWIKPQGTGRYVGGREVTNPGFDCSGLIYYAYRQPTVGITNIPRVASAQQDFAKAVNKGDAQPGDLLFWGRPAHHVGVYIGNNQYIQAPSTGDVVKISNVNWIKVTSVGRVLE